MVYSFRRVNPAASLKRDHRRLPPVSDVRRFRRVNPAASLKPTGATAAPCVSAIRVVCSDCAAIRFFDANVLGLDLSKDFLSP